MSDTVTRENLRHIVQSAAQLSDKLEKAFRQQPGGLQGTIAGVLQAFEDAGGFKELERLTRLEREITEAHALERRLRQGATPPADVGGLVRDDH